MTHTTGRTLSTFTAIALAGLMLPVAQAADADLGLAHQLFVVDHSGSLRGQYDWIGDVAATLQASEQVSARFGLMEFSENAHAVAIGKKSFGNATEFKNGVKRLKRGGASEDGYRAIEQAITQYALDRRVAPHIVLITDEHRTATKQGVNADSLSLQLLDANVPVTAIVNARFFCDDDRAALGMTALGGIVSLPDGRLDTCTIGKVAEPNQSSRSVTDYVDFALTSGGSAWDIRIPRSGKNGSQLFARAFTEIHGAVIAEQLLAVDAIPDVSFSPNNPRVGDVVTFDGSASRATHDGDYLGAMQWDFNSDRQFDTSGTTVAHVFTTPGVYKVTLALSTNRSDQPSTHTFEITINE